jgi:virginiamycin B lyase
LKLDSRTGKFTPYYVPHSGNESGGIYGLTVSHVGEVWLTITADNMIARLDAAASHFILYRIPTAGSLPLGIVIGADHTLWFTESGKDKIGMLKP